MKYESSDGRHSGAKIAPETLCGIFMGTVLKNAPECLWGDVCPRGATLGPSLTRLAVELSMLAFG